MSYIDLKLPKVLYHYCSWKTFENIIKHKTIRFSDVMKSNDSQEIIYLFKKYLDMQEKDLPSALFEKEIKKALIGQTYYTFCLSKKKDLLSQWRGYASDGGVCIGFSTKKLEQWAKSIEVLESKAEIIPVLYIDSMKELCESVKSDPIHAKHFEQLLKWSCKYKNKGFKEEEEVRICFRNYYEFCDEQYELPVVKQAGNKCDLNFILTKNAILKSYYDILFDYDMINEIMIGPRLNFTPGELKTYLLNCSVELYNLISKGQIKLTKTKLSFR